MPNKIIGVPTRSFNENLGTFKTILVRCLSNLTLIQDRVEKGLINDEFGQIEIGVKFYPGLEFHILNSLPNSLPRRTQSNILKHSKKIN